LARASFRPHAPNPADDAAITASKARDDLVCSALALAGVVRSTHDAEQVGDGLVGLVLTAENYIAAQQRLTALLAEHEAQR
jgi:hypothetical protein